MKKSPARRKPVDSVVGLRAAAKALHAAAAADRRENIAFSKRMAAARKQREAESKRLDKQMNKTSHALESEGIIDVMDMMRLPVLRRNFARAMRDIGMPMETVKCRVRSRVQREEECDILGINADTAVNCDVRAWLDFGAVDQMSRKVKEFREVFPRYDRPKVHGAIVGLSVDKRAVAFAHEKGFLVFEGKDMAPLLPPDFTPRKY